MQETQLFLSTLILLWCWVGDNISQRHLCKHASPMWSQTFPLPSNKPHFLAQKCMFINGLVCYSKHSLITGGTLYHPIHTPGSLSKLYIDKSNIELKQQYIYKSRMLLDSYFLLPSIANSKLTILPMLICIFAVQQLLQVEDLNSKCWDQ